MMSSNHESPIQTGTPDAVRRFMEMGDSEGISEENLRGFAARFIESDRCALDSFSEAQIRIMVRVFKRLCCTPSEADLANQRAKLLAIANEQGASADLIQSASIAFLVFSLPLPDSTLAEYVREEHLCWLRDQKAAPAHIH
jgi:hypothetical protein